jgi:hypothetical protein
MKIALALTFGLSPAAEREFSARPEFSTAPDASD